MSTERPWFASYAPGVPHDVDVPDEAVTASLDRAAARFPRRVALDFLGRTTTYAELAHQVARAAQALYDLGVRPGDRVALVLPNAPSHIVAFLATLRLRAVVVEHNPTYSATELAHQLADSGAEVAVVWEKAVAAVLKAKPDSPVKVLADGNTPVTAFLPTDQAFRDLAKSLTGTTYNQERAVFNALVSAAGVDTIENVLLYHVVPGATITAKKALRSNGAVLTTAQGATITVGVADRKVPLIVLQDQDPDAFDPIVDPMALNINKGNKQVAHGIVFVLRPADL